MLNRKFEFFNKYKILIKSRNKKLYQKMKQTIPNNKMRMKISDKKQLIYKEIIILKINLFNSNKIIKNK